MLAEGTTTLGQNRTGLAAALGYVLGGASGCGFVPFGGGTAGRYESSFRRWRRTATATISARTPVHGQAVDMPKPAAGTTTLGQNRTGLAVAFG